MPSKQRPSTAVRVKFAPWYAPKKLTQRALTMPVLRRLMLDVQKCKGPCSIIVHDKACPFFIYIWPRASQGVDGKEHDEALDDVEDNCTCTPLIMYTGALA